MLMCLARARAYCRFLVQNDHSPQPAVVPAATHRARSMRVEIDRDLLPDLDGDRAAFQKAMADGRLSLDRQDWRLDWEDDDFPVPRPPA